MFESLRKRMEERKNKNRDPFMRKNDLERPATLCNVESEQKENQNYRLSQKEIESSKSIQTGSVTSLAQKVEGVKAPNRFRKLISENVSKLEFQRFIANSHKGAFYSLKYLRGPSEKHLESKRVKLSEPRNAKKKFLFLDLDETLIHSVIKTQPFDVELKFEGQESIYFNIRPGCFQIFRENKLILYRIYLYCNTIGYAQPIVQYLNKQKHVIQGILSRSECMETRNGCFIKDLRIVLNRELKDIVIVDNIIHSFGLQIDNGIPILDFTNDPNDAQLLYVQKILMRLKGEEDVRTFLTKQLDLRNLITVRYKDLLS